MLLKRIKELIRLDSSEHYLLMLFDEALGALRLNRLRTMLTALGIIFGVAAVISMLAIGNGARKEILDQMKLVGANNIVITSEIPESATKNKESSNAPVLNVEKRNNKSLSPGLTLHDVNSFKQMPDIEAVCSEVKSETQITVNSRSHDAIIYGVDREYFSLFNHVLIEGKFFDDFQQLNSAAVCVIGHGIKSKLFKNQSPLDKYIRCNKQWYKIVGVLEKKEISSEAKKNKFISESDFAVFIPTNTYLKYISDRSIALSGLSISMYLMNENYHQLDRIIVKAKHSEQLSNLSQIINRMLQRRHYKVKDYTVAVPELLLKQQQKTRSVFNIVLGVIAGISLLVGGIGIMNIMFVSVLERTREIGVRIAVGATRLEIRRQFLIEASLICLTGGFIGILLGIALAFSIEFFTEIKVIISIWSVLVSFGISVLTGLIFGYLPAKRAAEQEPVKSLQFQ